MIRDKQKQVYTFLESFLTENKQELFQRVISNRTYHLTVVLENLFQAYNSNAVLRTCDIFGIQDVHIIENEHKFNFHKDVSKGATKWLDIYRYNELENNSESCFEKLKKDGYRIVVTKPDVTAKSIYDLDITPKTALVFGSELKGISAIAEQYADDFITVPMHGFTESLNISVCAALGLQILTKKLKESNVQWMIEGEDKYTILVDWAKKCIRKSDLLEKRILKEIED